MTTLPPEARTSGSRQWMATRVLLALALVAVLMLLQFAGRTSAMRERGAPAVSPLTIDPIPFRAASSVLTITGTAPANAVIEVGAGERELTGGVSDSRGRYEIPVDVPPLASRLWVRLADEPERPPAWFTVPPAAGADAVTIDVATFVADRDLLWVAGRAPHWSTVALRIDDDDVAVRVDRGIFEALVPLAKAPSLVSAAVQAADPVQVASRPVVSQSSADLPLARSVEFSLGEKDASLWFRVELPVGHPLVVAARQRVVTPQELVEHLFGWFAPLGSASLRLELADSTAVITITGSSLGTRFGFDPADGLARRQLLTAKDVISVGFSAAAPVWFDGTPPTELTAERATWRGPLQEPLAAQFGVGAMTRASPSAGPQRPEAPPPQPERTRAFLAGFEQRAPAYLAWPLWAAKILVPFAWFVWLMGRPPFAGWPVARAFAAGAVVLAIVRVWPFVEWFVSQTLNRALSGPARDLLWMLGGRNDLPWKTFGIPSWNALALLLVLISVSAPSLMRAFEGSHTAARLVPSGRVVGRLFRTTRLVVALSALTVLWLAYRFQWLAPTSEGRELFGRVWSLIPEAPPLSPDAASEGSFDPVVRGAAFLGGFCLLSLACGVRAVMLAAGVSLVALRFALPVRDGAALADVPALRDWLGPIEAIPLEAAIGGAALLAWPTVSWLLRRLLAPLELSRRIRWTLALAICCTAVWLHRIPVRLALVTGAVLIACGFVAVAIAMTSKTGLVSLLLERLRDRRVAAWGLAVSLALAFVWPFAPPGETMRFAYISDLVGELHNPTVYVLAFALTLAMRDFALGHDSVLLDAAWRPVGIYFFAVILLNSAVSWVFLPVPLILGAAIAWLWLFRSPREMARLADATNRRTTDVTRLITDVLDAKRGTARFRAIEKTLDTKLTAAELTPTQYRNKLRQYRRHLAAEMELDEVSPGVRSRDIVFALGHGNLRDNIASAVTAGAVLAAVPVVIAMYQYVPQSTVRYPYPIAGITSFLFQASAQWLLYAFFFGFFYAHLRGASGLTKGINLCAALVIPFFGYRLLSTQNLQDMVPFFLWAAQVFMFCSLIGILAFDYRLLRRHDFRARDLITLHNLPAISAYASTVIAALASGLVALLTNRFTDLARFFIDAIIGAGGGGPTGGTG